MDDNVAVPLICDFLVNCDEEIERFLRNENDFDFVAIAGVSCCFVHRLSVELFMVIHYTCPDNYYYYTSDS